MQLDYHWHSVYLCISDTHPSRRIENVAIRTILAFAGDSIENLIGTSLAFEGVHIEALVGTSTAGLKVGIVVGIEAHTAHPPSNCNFATIHTPACGPEEERPRGGAVVLLPVLLVAEVEVGGLAVGRVLHLNQDRDIKLFISGILHVFMTRIRLLSQNKNIFSNFYPHLLSVKQSKSGFQIQSKIKVKFLLLDTSKNCMYRNHSRGRNFRAFLDTLLFLEHLLIYFCTFIVGWEEKNFIKDNLTILARGGGVKSLPPLSVLASVFIPKDSVYLLVLVVLVGSPAVRVVRVQGQPSRGGTERVRRPITKTEFPHLFLQVIIQGRCWMA